MKNDEKSKKSEMGRKTIYLRRDLIKKIEESAKKSDRSFNYSVIDTLERVYSE